MSDLIIAIDPGPVESGWVSFDGGRVIEASTVANDWLLLKLPNVRDTPVAVEMIASYGMPVGKEVFETCVWIGRFIQARHPYKTRLVYRKDVKMHLCGSPRAKDANIRQALLDKFGGKDAAVGRKATPGPLYGVKSHAWAALGVAVTALETT